MVQSLGARMAERRQAAVESVFVVGARIARELQENDPTGRVAGEPGAKLDGGKVRLGLVLHGFPRALTVVGRVGTFGADKYSDNGWLQVPDGQQRYTDALYRHLMAEATGELVDGDSGLLHAAHAAWNALARLELALIAVEQEFGVYRGKDCAGKVGD